MGQWLFDLTAILYLASVAGYFVYFFFRQMDAASTWVFRVAWLIHTATLVVRVMEVNHPPLYTSFEWVLFLSWILSLNYFLLETLFRLKVVGAFTLPVVFLFMAYAATLPQGLEPSSVPRAGYWVVVHALIALGGYGTFALAAVASVMYILQEKQLRAKAFHLVYQRLPSLETLDNLAYKPVIYGFPLFSMAIVMGSIWASESWAVPWFREPKGLWSMVTWVIYAGYILGRSRGIWRGRKGAYILVFGFATVLWNLFVVNMALTRQHVF